MFIDALIVLFAISALYRGRDIGFIRQLCSTAGFFGGLFLGAWLEPHVIGLAHSPAGRSLVTLLSTLGCALLLLTVGESFGVYLKRRILLKRANGLDRRLGSVLNLAALLLSVWLLAAVIGSLPFSGVQSTLQSSRIINTLNRVLPGAPTVIADLSHLIDPNGFPQVFLGAEPSPRSGVSLPALGELQTAVAHDKMSVVKVAGQGCGGIVEGSGFVVGPGLVATNAHVIAGIHQPYVQDSKGTHSATAVWFDPNLDFAVLKVADLAGSSLKISTAPISPSTAAVVLGYPGGGALRADVAAVLDQFTASGRNIYGSGNTTRDVYEVRADIIPGNSGGPLIAKDGQVIGVVFAESTTYRHVGYALTTPQVSGEIKQAAHHAPVSTGRCTES